MDGKTRLLGLGYGAVSTLAIGLVSSWGRPLWFDETIQFMFGGLPALTDVLSVLHDTTPNLNQGATGAYMVVDWWLLQSFGAQTWALRLPSMAAAAFMLLAAWVFLRTQRIGPTGIMVTPLVFLGLGGLFSYAGEARPYMPLAAAVAGALAYYCIDLRVRARWTVVLLGWASVLIGVLFHPYFALYWPGLIIFTFALSRRNTSSTISLRAVARHANMPLVVTGGAVAAAIAAATWLRGNASGQLNPYTWLGDAMWKVLVQQLTPFAMLDKHLAYAVLATFVALGALAWAGTRSLRVAVRTLEWPTLLVGLGVVLALVISWSSARAGFWIIPRQWIGSMPLVVLGLVWFADSALGLLAPRHPRAARTTVVALAVTVCLLTLKVADDHRRELTGEVPWPTPSYLSDGHQWTQAQLRAQLDAGIELDSLDWVAFSQGNVRQGGNVWPEFARFYTDRDWSTFKLRDPQ